MYHMSTSQSVAQHSDVERRRRRRPRRLLSEALIKLSKAGPYLLHVTRYSRMPHMTRDINMLSARYSVIFVILIGVISSA